VKVEYDPETDAAYIKLSESEIAESEEVKPGIILDYDAQERVVGIEILYVSKRRPDVDLERLEVETVKKS
jgi:uncharacterized protein YuzE